MATHEDAVVANIILNHQKTALAILILADDDSEEEKASDSIFAEYVTEHNRATTERYRQTHDFFF